MSKLTVQQAIRQAMINRGEVEVTLSVLRGPDGNRTLVATTDSPAGTGALRGRTSVKIFSELLGSLVPARGGSFYTRVREAGYVLNVRTVRGGTNTVQVVKISRPSGPLTTAPAERRTARQTKGVARTAAAASQPTATSISRASVPPLKLGSHTGTTFSALLISPALKQLVRVTSIREYVQLYYPGSTVREGEGYLDRHEAYIFEGETYRRSHTPAGVRDKEHKIGPLLYYGLCLLAVSEFDCAGIGSGPPSSGVIHRSDFARDFWMGQVRRGHAIDVTKATEPGRTREKVIQVPVLDSDLCDLVGDDACDTVTAATSEMRIAYRTKGREIPLVQLMNVASVVDQNIIVNWTGRAPVEIPKLPADIICGLNLKDCKDVDLIIALAKYCLEERIAPEYVQNMLSKVPTNILHTVTARLGYTPNSKFRPNAEVQKEVDAVWKEFYGDLVTEY